MKDNWNLAMYSVIWIVFSTIRRFFLARKGTSNKACLILYTKPFGDAEIQCSILETAAKRKNQSEVGALGAWLNPTVTMRKVTLLLSPLCRELREAEDIAASLGSSETLYKTRVKYNAIESGRTLKTTHQKLHFFTSSPTNSYWSEKFKQIHLFLLEHTDCLVAITRKLRKQMSAIGLTS